MKELFKKTLYLGVGALTVTKEKIEEVVDELIKKGEANQSERAKLVNEFMQKAREQEKEITAKIKSLVQTTWQEKGFPTRKEIDELKQRIEELEKQLKEHHHDAPDA